MSRCTSTKICCKYILLAVVVIEWLSLSCFDVPILSNKQWKFDLCCFLNLYQRVDAFNVHLFRTCFSFLITPCSVTLHLLLYFCFVYQSSSSYLFLSSSNLERSIVVHYTHIWFVFAVISLFTFNLTFNSIDVNAKVNDLDTKAYRNWTKPNTQSNTK